MATADRTLLEIIEDAKDGNKPSHDECYWAMLALAALHTFDSHDILDLLDADPRKLKFTVEEAFQRGKRVFAEPPQKYVGWSHDPANPEYQKMRRLAFKVLEKATGIKKD